MNQDVVPADKNLRKKFIIFFVLFTIAVILIEPYINRYIEQIKQISEKNPELAFKKSMFMLKLTLGVVFVLLLMTGVYLIVLARRTFKSGQYPPLGMKVIRDTRLRTGTQAERPGISLIICSCILIVIAFFFLYWPYAFEKTVSKKKSSDTKRNISEKERGVIELKGKGSETK
jgi:hypothetical protein